MTKDELKKRLKFVPATPINESVPPRDVVRRDPNKVAITEEYIDSKFDSFFEYEEEIAEMESARKQQEKIDAAQLKKEVVESSTIPEETQSEEDDSSFLMFEEDECSKLGDDSSFFVFEEDEEGDEVLEEVTEEIIEEDNSKKVEEVENPIVVQREEAKVYTEVKGFDFKYCKYIKANDEQCKRQAPKTGDYCGTHRKLLERLAK